LGKDTEEEYLLVRSVRKRLEERQRRRVSIDTQWKKKASEIDEEEE
jgi:hypothetical protein